MIRLPINTCFPKSVQWLPNGAAKVAYSHHPAEGTETITYESSNRIHPEFIDAWEGLANALYEDYVPTEDYEDGSEATLHIHKAAFSYNKCQLAEDGDLLATYKKNADGVTLDSKRLKEELPDIYKQYLTVRKGPRVMRLKQKTIGKYQERGL